MDHIYDYRRSASRTVFLVTERTARLVKLQFDNNKQYKLTLPKALIDAKGWKKGSEIKVELDSQGNLVLKLTEDEEKN